MASAIRSDDRPMRRNRQPWCECRQHERSAVFELNNEAKTTEAIVFCQEDRYCEQETVAGIGN